MITDKNGDVWYKGNLHTHTTDSDGVKTPLETMELYKERGYDFIALTDHWHVDPSSDYKGMLILSGAEYDVCEGGCHHILGYGLNAVPKAKPEMSPQEIVNAIRRAGGVVTLAHPAWSLNEPSDLYRLTGVDCTEIYNSVSGFPYSARPYSGNIIDIAMAHGFRATLTAADDTHFYGAELGYACVYVRAGELTRDAIIAAILAGDCYGTQGPIIDFFGVEDGKVVVRVGNGCKYVQFFSDNYWQADTTCTGGTVYEASFKIKLYDSFVRAEIVDFDGKTAYTQALWVK